MKDNTISISFIKSFPSIQEGIFYLTGISKSGLKKYHFKKTFLEKEIRFKDSIEFPISLINHKKINPTYNGNQVKILFEDPNILALSKPEKIHSHPLSYEESDNLLSSFYELKKSHLLNINPESYDRGLMHRLDFETSGLIIYIKNAEVLKEVSLKRNQLINAKYYYAIVQGKVESDRLIHYLKPYGAKGEKMVESVSGIENQLSLTLKEYNEEKNYSLVCVKLEEGHRHQIRAQLSCAGHPIIGDELYDGVRAKRLYLHCYNYQFSIGETQYDIKDSDFNGLSEFFDFDSKL